MFLTLGKFLCIAFLQSWVHFIPVHTSCQVQATIQTRACKTIPHPPYSPVMAICNFWLFSTLKGMLCGKHHKLRAELEAPITWTLPVMSHDGLQYVWHAHRMMEQVCCFWEYQLWKRWIYLFTLGYLNLFFRKKETNLTVRPRTIYVFCIPLVKILNCT